MKDEEVKELISRRRHQIMVHSTLYYQLDMNLIDDHTFDLWSKQLANLQNTYPELAEEVDYAKIFRDFTGATGFHVSNTPWGWEKANYLIKLKEKGYFT